MQQRDLIGRSPHAASTAASHVPSTTYTTTRIGASHHAERDPEQRGRDQQRRRDGERAEAYELAQLRLRAAAVQRAPPQEVASEPT